VPLLCWHSFYDALKHIIEYASKAIALHNAMLTEKKVFIFRFLYEDITINGKGPMLCT
jgi:hypothetical protein